MQTRWYHAAALAVGLALAAPSTLLAQDADGKQGNDGKTENAEVVRKPKRTERAAQIVRELEAAKQRLADAGQLDDATRKALDRSLAHARALVRPTKAAELTDEERKALVEELAAEIKGSTQAAKDPVRDADSPLSGWQERAVARAFQDVDLGEEQQLAATKVITEWFTKAMEARRQRDSKGQSDAKRERDRKLKSLLGKKTSRQVIRNLDRISGRGGAGPGGGRL